MTERGAGLPKTSLDPATMFGTLGGVASQSGWFGPLAPLRPIAPPEVTGRQFDLQPGANITARPRQGEAVTFDQLRALADGYDLLRLVIETRKDQIDRMKWSFRARDKKTVSKEAIASVTTFFNRPDGEHNFSQWLRMILEDLFVLDAPTVWKQRTRGGQLFALHPLDGATIKRVIDDWGRTPQRYTDETGKSVLPPAYQQVLKGYPAVNYTVEDLIYAPRNIRTNRVYGYSPVEQVIMTVNIALRRQLGTLDYYTEGNIPSALIGVPDAWTPDQIKAFQDYWDIYFTGDTASRRKAKFVPGGVAKTYIPTKEPELKGLFDEWLARIVCFAFSISSQPFVSQVNRATAGTQKEQAEEEGLVPILQWIKHLIDEIITKDLGVADVEFAWGDDVQVEPGEEAVILSTYVDKALMTRNEAREKLGLDPTDTPEANELGFTTAAGFVYLDESKKPEPPEPLLGAGGPLGDDGLPSDKKPPVKDDAKSAVAEKLDELFDLFKNEGHNVDDQPRDNRGRFSSTGGPSSREKAKAERKAKSKDDEKVVRDEMGRFKAGKITKARAKEIAHKIIGKVAVAAALSVSAAAVAAVGGTDSKIGSAIHETAKGFAHSMLVSSAETALATAIRMMGAEAEEAQKYAAIARRVVIKYFFSKKEDAEDMLKAADSQEDIDFVMMVAKVTLPRFTDRLISALMTHIDLHGMPQEKQDALESALENARSELLEAIDSMGKSLASMS